MNNKLRSVMRYIVKNYPYPDDLTKTRITKLVYLIDWENVKEYGSQITNIEWFFDHYGPYVSDVLDEADEDKTVSINSTISNFGTVKYIVKPKRDKEELSYDDLTDNDKLIIDRVIEETKSFYWNEFINYVYSTEPIKKSTRYSALDLKSFI
ncbi:Panacea domain-containing protein [Peptoniphilus asaccharolyticus]